MNNTIDSKALTSAGGFDLTAYLVPDTDTRPTDFDCYNDETVSAWKQDRWSYVGMIVVASRNGIELGSDSLWGCEYGDMPGITEWVSPLTDANYMDDMVSNAIADARMNIAAIVAADGPAA